MPGGHLNLMRTLDFIDSYVLRMSQVSGNVKLWRNANFGKPQKHPSIPEFNSTLINVNNLRDAIDLAKRVLTKGKTGQTTDWTSPPPHL